MTATAFRPALTAARPAHRDPNVLRWVGAYASSMIGDNVYYLALSWAAVRAGSPAQAGLVMAVSAVPRALLMLGGGVVADRLGPRRVVIGSDAVRCAAVIAVAVLLLATEPALWLLAGLALVFGTVDALFLPAVGALPARITGRDQLARVHGMRGIASRVANVVGAPLGGLGVALGGAAAAFGVAGLLFAASLPLLISVRIGDLPGDEGQGGRTAWSELRAGLRYIRRHRVLAPLIVVIALSDLGFVGPLNVGLALLADERGWGASGMGWILAAFGVGAGAVSLLLTLLGRIPRAGFVLSTTAFVGSAAIGALAYVPYIEAGVGVALLIGLLAGLSGGLCGALVQTESDPAYVGRVTAVSMFFSLGLAPLTFPLTGAAIGLWGTGPVFTTSAAICGLAGAVGLYARHLRRAELPR
ncbi:MFS transporter [Streptomyces sp. PSKA54]|uniref:MFS transporter n=1 Tax=Streptomyces himalayensis subsp. aureolus TaxID=2758039 RepID=A0A7W2CWA4_9ACTN|nr:MFS transporter [Streptomyces himalayensis]MBA4860081.1 MFS transporter [Streptomyces himalayensis subsp. aureolus]